MFLVPLGRSWSKYCAVFPVETNVWMCNRHVFWQPEEDCLDCAACCGPAFDAVEVSVRDPFEKYPQLIKRKMVVLCETRGEFCSQLGKGNRCGYFWSTKCCRDLQNHRWNCRLLDNAWDVQESESTKWLKKRALLVLHSRISKDTYGDIFLERLCCIV